MPFQQKTIKFTADNIEYELPNLTNGNTSKPPLLLLGPPTLMKLLPEDIRKNFNVIAFTFPYKGDSKLSKKFPTKNLMSSVDTWVKMIFLFSQAIQAEYKQKPMVLGHSLAGTLAKWAASHAQADNYIKGAVALNSPWLIQGQKIHNANIDKVLEFFKHPEDFYHNVENIKAQTSVATAFGEAMKADFDQNGIPIHVNFLKNLFKYDNLPNKGKLPLATKVPVLQVNAVNDDFVPIAQVKQRTANIKNCELVALEKGKHFLPYEFPAEVAKSVLRFSKQLTEGEQKTLEPVSTVPFAPLVKA